MTSSSTLSLVLLAALCFVGSNGQCSTDGCIATLAEVQVCLRECGNKDPVPAWGGRYNFATNGGSRLFQCLPDFNEGGLNKTKVFDKEDGLNDLVGCCEMSAACNQTMLDARECANPQSGSGCIQPCVKDTAKDYLTCIIGKANENVCRFASLCVGQLTGNDMFDFAATLAQDANTADTTDCASMNGFVDGICDISQACCPHCNADMTQLAGCLVNDLIIPASAAAGTTCSIDAPLIQNPQPGGPEVRKCGISGAVTAVARSSATGGEETGTSAMDVDGVDISDCEERLTLEFIVHNASYAADGFMQCIGKKVGKVLAETEGENVSNPEPSTAARSATLMSFGATVMVASSVWSMLA